MSSYPIIWSPLARSSYFQTLEYLEEHWPLKTLKDFINRVEELIDLISSNPLIFPYSKENDVHKCVVVKQVTLFYRVKPTFVELLVFWDNRQKPNRLFS